MWDTMEEAIVEALADGLEATDVEWCVVCDCYTYVDHDGYPVCYCS